MAAIEFFRPVVRNDWGRLHYEHPDRPGVRLPFIVGDPVTVRWPDGSESRETLSERVHIESVSDHGKAYDVTSYVYGVSVEHRGIWFWANASRLELRMEADDGGD